MIWESHYWKKDLARLADCLRKRARQRQWSERSLAKMEKEVFIGFYSLRKLLEGKKLSGKVVNRVIPADSFSYTGSQRITLLNWNTRVADAFAFDKPKKINLPIMFLCNQVIHSYVYKEVFDEEGLLTGIFISSDREKTRKLYFVAVTELIGLFTRIGKDYPSSREYQFDPNTDDYIVRNW
jgi:hypothetical protein